jgi:hypothetical protein
MMMNKFNIFKLLGINFNKYTLCNKLPLNMSGMTVIIRYISGLKKRDMMDFYLMELMDMMYNEGEERDIKEGIDVNRKELNGPGGVWMIKVN